MTIPTEYVVISKVGPASYRFAVKGDFTPEQLSFALDQLKAILQGIVKDGQAPREVTGEELAAALSQ